MRNERQSQLMMGLALVALGVLFLVGNLLGINVWALIFPLGLIALGIWMLMRPGMVEEGTAITQRIFGDVRREGPGPVGAEEIWVGIGDVRLDLRDADIPWGDTAYRIYSVIGDIKVRVPEDVGVVVSSVGLVSEVKVAGRKESAFFGSIRRATDDFESAERRLSIEVTSFITDVDVRRD